MNLLFKAVRFFGVAIGVFIVFSGLVGMLGLIPYSNATPPMSERVLSNLPSFLCGTVLLIPHRVFSRGYRLKLLIAAYFLVSIAAFALFADGFVSYLTGNKSWHVIPAGMVLLFIPVANAFILFRRRASDTLAT